MALRWEWRVFGSRLGPADQVLSAMTPLGEPQESDEIYILGDQSANLKIRFDLLDIKKLIEVDDAGLQLWAPVSKAEFPVTTDHARSIFAAMGASPPETSRDTHTLQEFLEDLVAPHPDLEIVNVHKRRVRYAFDGCMAELTSMSANGQATETIAAESEDPAAVAGAIETLGMGNHVNTSYSRALRCLLGLAPARYAVTDIGTNSVKFHIGEQHPDGSWIRVVDRAEVTRLGEGLNETGEIQPEPLERTVRAVETMAEEAKRNQVLGMAAVGTAALRIAGNSSLVTDSIRDRVGIGVEVVSGEEESRLAYLAVVAELGLADEPVVVFDTGGGSSQFTFGVGYDVEERFSVDVGAVSYTERFGLADPVDGPTLDAVRKTVQDDLARLDGRKAPAALVGMGGAVTNITAVSLSLDPYDPDAVQGARIDLAEVERQIETYASKGQDERRGIAGLQPNRAPVILAGALIVATVMGKLGRDHLVVSDRGLRHGLIRERFGLFS
jgi:exopolyphosphatase/guanosine-5'-triphosphate,3'-diphosphate pyrophosphatase